MTKRQNMAMLIGMMVAAAADVVIAIGVWILVL
jgi:hypothetical protein